jgi:SAM-dependent methyltransferase
MNTVKQVVISLLPKIIVEKYSKAKLTKRREVNKQMSTQEVFTRIYENNEWGGTSGELYSGTGSDSEITQNYCRMVKEFVQQQDIKSIVDLGCGDFRVGINLQVPNVKYTGVDIVQKLIDKNNQQFGNENITFLCRNIVDDALPTGDLCLIRQVLQHLSNQQILKILSKTKQYKYVMITEHYPPDSVKAIPNLDKPHGGDTRIIDNSAVYLDKPPFNVANLSIFLEADADKTSSGEYEKLRTMLIDNT